LQSNAACQNFGISGGGGFEHPKPPLSTPLPKGKRNRQRPIRIQTKVHMIRFYGTWHSVLS